MTDRARKISELVAATSAAANDLLVAVTNTSGVAATKKITVGGLFSNVNANVNFRQTINVGSNVTVNSSTIFFGNSTVNTFINSTGFFVNGNAIPATNTGSIRFNSGIIYHISNGDIWIDPSNDNGNTGYISVPGPTNANSSALVVENQKQGGVEVRSNNKIWYFYSNGAFNIPSYLQTGNSIVRTVANSSGDGNGYSTLVLIPDNQLSTDQKVVIDPTAPNHIHIRAGGTQDNSSAELYLGGENSHFMVESGADPKVAIKSNSFRWQFGTDGILTLPNGVNDTSGFNFPSNPGGGSGDTAFIKYYPLTSENMLLEIRSRNDSEDSIRLDASGEVQIITNGGYSNYTWTFHFDGGLEFPDNTKQTTAYDNKLLKIANTTPQTANDTTRYILCDPNAAGGNVEVILPNGNFDGKEYTIKNINTGSYNVNISLANGSSYIESNTGSFGTTFTISGSGRFATWVWDQDALTYRIMGHNIT